MTVGDATAQQARTTSAPSSASTSGLAVPFILVAASLVAVGLVDSATRTVPVYLTPDAGHYLEDARAFFGDGVRENRHLPGFPLLLGLVGFFTSDLAALRVTIALLIPAAVAAFSIFIRGRLRSPVAEAAGACVFAMSSVYAEAVGWFGGAMLLGVILATIALRAIETLLTSPGRRHALLAGAAVGAVGLTHPFWVLVVVQVTFLVTLATVVLPLVGGSPVVRGAAVRQVGWLAAAAATAVVIVLPVAPFYVDVQNPIDVAASTTNLRLLENWAFREAPAFGLVVLAGLAAVIPIGGALAGSTGRRLGMWVVAVGVVVLVNLVFISGDPTYTNRIIYAVPLIAGSAVAALLGGSAALAQRAGSGQLGAILTVVLVGSVALLTTITFRQRLDAAVPYFNHVAPLELDAISTLEGRPGAVLVAPRADDDAYAAGLYAWMFEGLLGRRAMGPTYAGVNLFDRGIAESDDAARIVAGSEVVEVGSVQLGHTPGGLLPAHVSVRAEHVWSRVLRIEQTPHLVPSPGPDGGVLVNLPAPPASAVLTLVQLPTGRPAVELEGSSARLTVRVGERRVTFDVRVTGGRLEPDFEVPGATRLRVVPLGSDEPSLAFRVVDDPLDAQVRRFSDRELLAKRDFRDVVTWSGTEELHRLAARPCFVQAETNEVVALLRVTEACRRRPRSP